MRLKMFYVFVLFLGMLLGYEGLRRIHSALPSKGGVLSFEFDFDVAQNHSVSETPTYVPSDTPSPSPEPTATLAPTAIPTQKPKPTAIATPSPIPTTHSLPTASPTVAPISAVTPFKEVNAPADLEPLFDEFSVAYGVDENRLKHIADCESHFNTGVYAHPYAGMYQFTEKTWETYRNMMGKDPNINLRFGARESIETAAYVLSIGRGSIWPSCYGD